MNLKPLPDQKFDEGFTLLEVIIALAILTFISIGIYQATTQTFKLRESLSNEGDFYNSIRLAMDIVGRDIAVIYDPKMSLPPPKKKTNNSGNPGNLGNPQNGAPAPDPLNQDPNADPTNDSPKLGAKEAPIFIEAGVTIEKKYWAPVLDKTGVRPSRFQGTDKKMSFISTSHVRIYKDAPESEFAKIEYEIGTDPHEKDPALSSLQVLYKNESPNVYEDEDQKDKRGVRLPLLKGIKSMSFEYYNKAKDTWLKSWDSINPDQKGKFPDRVKVLITIEGVTPDLKFEGEYIFRPEVPLSGLESSS